MVLKRLSRNFPANLGHLSGLNKLSVRLLNIGHFTFWGDLTKAAVAIVCVDRFN